MKERKKKQKKQRNAPVSPARVEALLVDLFLQFMEFIIVLGVVTGEPKLA